MDNTKIKAICWNVTPEMVGIIQNMQTKITEQSKLLKELQLKLSKIVNLTEYLLNEPTIKLVKFLSNLRETEQFEDQLLRHHHVDITLELERIARLKEFLLNESSTKLKED